MVNMSSPLSSLRPGQPATQQSYSRLPNQQTDADGTNYFDQDDELDAAFNEPEEAGHHESRRMDEDDEDEDEEEDERHGLVSHQASASSSSKMILTDKTQVQPSRTYDFEPDSSSTRFHPNAGSPTPSLGPPSLVRLAGMGGGVQNDGVFANLSAKPDGPGARLNPSTGQMEFVGGNDDGHPTDKEEVLPTYDSAALDSAPPYWETTVTLPGVNSGPYGLLGPDDILVDGLPVGNLFGFAWNLLVSMSFQFIGFLLTYLLHTTHAAKNGSRAGLGITLIQYGLYTRTRALEGTNGVGGGASSRSSAYNSSSVPPTTTDPWGLFGPSSTSDWDGSTDRAAKGSQNMPYDGIPNNHGHVSGAANEWLGYILIAVGWFLLLGGLVNYWRAVRWARTVRNSDMLGEALA
ncbi:hypothetical protein PGT21_016988 [Puccinia graminis f. sp. tritici]|uniref:Metal homeostatis protein bsd2 n=2 Tax=Puccinia graminis f. sp. tritici TaxID=56615 RepID=E3K498_PUCGT|nr:uncharacterized protein PGTG_05429 [Puccinia graminis f. sp. tritici CRL 75-36-700-3]EFP79108.2 hypothetical protein PGTG_05429 [Puccinia graminis f. sp. tritici CRL 75-36-700-3]KAA1111951.1 hypothetical protein PGT21_016988 [Puccinia graminis f. sp. tritici]